MIQIKNISGEVLQLHTHEFEVDETLTTSEDWNIDPVIQAVVEGKIHLIGGNNLLEQLEILSGHYIAVAEIPPFGAKKQHNFKGQGTKFVAVPGVNNLDFTIPDGTYDFSGLTMFHEDHLGDLATLQVMDTSTGTYSTVPNYVLNEFATNWNVNRKECGKMLPYTARLLTGMIVRIKYTNALEVDQHIYVNYDLHKVIL